MADQEIEAPSAINIGNLSGAKPSSMPWITSCRRAVNNIYDVGTTATSARTITLMVKLKPDDAMIKIASEFSCDSSLAQPFPVTGVIFVGKEENGTLLLRLRNIRASRASSSRLRAAEARTRTKQVQQRKEVAASRSGVHLAMGCRKTVWRSSRCSIGSRA